MATGPGDTTQRPVKAATERARATSDEDTGEATTLDSRIFDLLTPSSRAALAQADWLAKLGGARWIHVDHLIVGLYRKRDGPTQRLFADAGLTTDGLARILEGIEEAIVPDPPLAVRDLELPPTISRHVAEAFEAARRIAAATPAPDTGLPWIQSRHLLYGVLSVERCTVSQALRRAGADKGKIPLGTTAASHDSSEVVDVADDPAGVIAGVRSDEATGPDLLDIGREVDALAKIIAAREVQPPLAIGLFGDWGTGKTFFMRQLQRRIRRISNFQKAQTTGKPTYCHEIVQLEFNAWHYIEENLWASLAAAIFDGLDESLTRAGKSRQDLDDDEVKRARILTGRASAENDLAVAEQAKAEADRHLAATDARLAVLATGSASPADIVAGAWSTANQRHPDHAGGEPGDGEHPRGGRATAS